MDILVLVRYKKDWGKEEKGVTEDEMVRWHHQLDGHEFEQDLRVGDGQGSLKSTELQSIGHNWMTAANDMWTHKKSNRFRVKENWWQGKVLCSTSHSGPQADKAPPSSTCGFQGLLVHWHPAITQREEKIWNIMGGQLPWTSLEEAAITSTALHWPGLPITWPYLPARETGRWSLAVGTGDLVKS